MTPQEAIEQLRGEGHRLRRVPGKDGCPVLLVVPGPAPAGLRPWLIEEWLPGWSNEIAMLRHLDALERPDSGRTVGTVPLRGRAAWGG